MTDDFLLQLYRLARESGPHEFQSAVVDRLNARLHFDSAFWCEGELPEGGGVVPTAAHIRNIDPDFLRDWAVANIEDPMIAWGKRCPGHAQQVMVSDYYGETPDIVALGERHAMRSLSIVNAFTPAGRSGEWISFFRSDADATGSTGELAWLEAVMPHLQEARRIHRMLHADETHPAHRGAACAVADRHNANLLRSNEAFRQLLAHEWRGFDGFRVPTPLRKAWAEQSRFVFDGRTVQVCGSVADSVVMLTARPFEMKPVLTVRQREIAMLSAQGWSYKEIAASTKLSPATVRNHLAAVYAALDVHSRRELARALKVDGS